MTEFEDEKPAGEQRNGSSEREQAASQPSPAPFSSESAAGVAGAAQTPPEIELPEIEPDVPAIAYVEPRPAEPRQTIPNPRMPAAPAAPPRTLFFARLVQAVWVGGGVFLGFAALAVFRTLDPTSAADAVGAMLSRWHYLALLAPAILILIEWRRMRSRMVLLLFVAVMFATLQGLADLRIRRIRTSSVVPISSLDRSDPVRRRFGALHGFSSLLLLAQIAVGVGVIAAEPDE